MTTVLTVSVHVVVLVGPDLGHARGLGRAGRTGAVVNEDVLGGGRHVPDIMLGTRCAGMTLTLTLKSEHESESPAERVTRKAEWLWTKIIIGNKNDC